MFDLTHLRKVHFIGIGGIGMSALARLFAHQGKKITGSDKDESQLTNELMTEGMSVSIGHNPQFLPDDAELVIVTEAISDDNPEFLKAKALNIPIMSYFQALGILSKKYFTIAVAGTHGKTTTTAMIADILVANGFDPTVVVGSKVKKFGNKNVRIGHSQYLLVEACEYRRSFLHLNPNLLVITNIEADHLDYYKDLDDYRLAFTEFARLVPADGLIVANGDDPEVNTVLNNFSNIRKIIRFGHNEGLDYTLRGDALYHEQKLLGHLDLPVPGEHNRLNAVGALAVSQALGLKPEKILAALSSFQGTWRRFEPKGIKDGIDLYDDYGHHPTEIAATLKAAREKWPNRRICLVFQPHQYSRTRKLWSEFTTAFNEADLLIIPNIYQVRDSEEDVKAVSPEKLVEAIRPFQPEVFFGNGFENTLILLEEHLKADDVLITMGAGDVWKIGEKWLE